MNISQKPKARKKSATSTTHYPLPTTHSQSVVWTFTNKKELDKTQFIDYIQRKVFRTIRKHQMLPQHSVIRGTPSGEPKNKIITLKKSNQLNTLVLKQILQTKFQVKLIPATSNQKPTTDTSNLSQEAEDIFKKIIKGNFKLKQKTNAPLIQLSDKEIELYAKLKNIKGTSRKQNKTIQSLFNKFLNKNQDLEINIIKAANQLKIQQIKT